MNAAIDPGLQFSARRHAAVTVAGAILALATIAQPALAVVVTGFEGTAQANNFLLDGAFRPPDTMGAIGTTQFVETTNGSITVYDRTNGAVLKREGANTFWQRNGQNGSSGDQRVLFDHYTNRWVMSGFCQNVNQICVAVSDTADALGTWRTTTIPALATGTADYPTLAMDDKAVYIATNNFTPNFIGTSLFSIPKADLFDGAPSIENMTAFTAPVAGPDRGFAIQGALNWQGNPTDTANIVAVSRDQFDTLTYKIQGVTGPGATQTAVVEVNEAAYTFNGPGRQPDGTRLVDTLDDRISANAVQANGRLYVVHTVTPSGETFSEVRWLVLDANSGTLIDQGRIGGGGFDYFQGAIAVNEFGQAVIGYNRSGFQAADGNGDGLADGRISIFAQVFGTDLGGGLDAVGDPLLLRVSDVDDYRCGPRTSIDMNCRQRWGDYAAVTIDPLDHQRFWVIGEYAAEWFNYGTSSAPLVRANWHTYIASLNLRLETVPEPGTLALLGLGLFGLGLSRRRKA